MSPDHDKKNIVTRSLEFDMYIVYIWKLEAISLIYRLYIVTSTIVFNTWSIYSNYEP